MRQDSSPATIDHDPYMLTMYRATLASVLSNTPLSTTLNTLALGIDQVCTGLSTAVLVLGDGRVNDVNNGEQGLQLIAPKLHPHCMESIKASPVDAGIFLIDQNAHEPMPSVALEQSPYWHQVRQIAAQHKLLLRAILPLVGSQENLLGLFYLFADSDQQVEPEQAHLIAEIARLSVLPIEHDQQQRHLHAATLAVRQSAMDMNRMALAIDGSATGIWDRHIQTGEIHYSPGWKALLGYADSEISHQIQDSYQRVHPDDLDFVQAAIQAHADGKTEHYAVEHRVRCKDGSYKWISSRGKIVSRDPDGKPLRMMGTTTDVTAMHILSERLRQSADLVTCLTNEVPGLAYQYQWWPDGREHFSYVSDGVRDIYELTPEQLRMSDGIELIHQMIHPDDIAHYRAAIAASADDLQHVHLEFRVHLPRQGLRWRQMIARPRRLPDGGTLWHGLITDVTEKKRVEKELQEFATIDFLTQIPNRRHFMERLEEELGRIQRAAGKPSAIMMCDLDHFKMINDVYGHAVGDLVLKHFAQILRQELRKSDTVGRIGGEEFAVILSGTDIESAHIFAQRVQEQIQGTPVTTNHHTIHVTVSIGITMMTSDDISADVSLFRSDTALYRAKENGRNRITIEVS